jgi:hypothetical protein
MVAAEERAVLLEPVADDPDAAMVAARGERMDGALEAVEGVGGSVHAHLERLVVVVSARLAPGHDRLPKVVGGLTVITCIVPRRFLRAGEIVEGVLGVARVCVRGPRAPATRPRGNARFGRNARDPAAAFIWGVDPFGFPLRLRTSTKLGFKNPKWITSIEVTNTYPGGYWEDRGFNWHSGL